MTAGIKPSISVPIVFAYLIGVVAGSLPLAFAQQTQPTPRIGERVHFGETAFVMPATRPTWPDVPGETYAAKIHAIVQQKPQGHADLLGPLAAVVAKNNDPRKAAIAAARSDPNLMNADDFPKLVDALLEGDADDQLLKQVMGQVHVDSYLKNTPDWKYGAVITRNAIQKFLWINAVTLKDADPAEAARYARACILFGAYDEIPSRVGVVWPMEQTEPQFSKVAQLSDAQVQTIKKMIDVDQAMLRPLGILTNTLTDSLDSWVDENSHAVSADQRQRFLILLNKWWISGDGGKVPMTAWQVANGSWRVMNLAKSVGDQETIDAVTAMLHGFEAELTNTDERCWMEEAITTPGPAPRHSAPFILKPSPAR